MLEKFNNYVKELKAFTEVDPWGEEEWEDDDKIFYSICCGFQKECFIIKVGKVYVNTMKDHYLKKQKDINQIDKNDPYPWKNLYTIEFMGGARKDIDIFFNKISINDLVRSRNVANSFDPPIIEQHLKNRDFLIQEKCMSLDEIKKLVDDIYNLQSANAIAGNERQIKRREIEINKFKKGIEKMKNKKLIEYKIDDIESIRRGTEGFW